MTTSEKRLLALICITLVILAGFILLRSYKHMSQTASLVEPSAGFHYSTAGSLLTKTMSGDTVTSSVCFTHCIYTSGENPLTDLTITVSGTGSPSECTISHISAVLSKQQWDGLSVSEHTAADTATVILYQDQLSVCHFQYRITPDGEIRLLK